MDRTIYTYALINALYDPEEDYIDCFWPFVLKSFSGSELLTLNSLQENLHNKYNLQMPQHVLVMVLERARKRHYIKKERRTYKLTFDGLKFLDTFETDKDVNRRIVALIKDMINFFKTRRIDLSPDQMQKLINSFLTKNVTPLIQFVSQSKHHVDIPKMDIHENSLVDYIKLVENQNPQHYKTFKDMVLGSLISVIIYAKKPSEINKMRNKWPHCQIFLDTNFIFSILNLHSHEFSKPAKELFNLLKKEGFSFKVFDFTLDEINRVITNFLKVKDHYIKKIKINSLYGSLNQKGWGKAEVRDFTINLEDILKEKNIEIIQTKINIKTFKPPQEDLRMHLWKYKPNQEINSQNHDLAAIDQIKKLRGKAIRKIEFSQALFLTSDAKLSNFNYFEMGHDDSGTICEVILDKLLTNILWLKDPKADVSLSAIIETYSRDLFIKNRIWTKFCNVLDDLIEKKEINDEKVSMLFYHDYIEPVLREFNEDDLNKIDEKFVLKEAEKSSKIKEEETQKIIEGKKIEIEKITLEQQEKLEKIKVMNEKEIQKIKTEKEKEILEIKNQKKTLLEKSIEREVSIYLYIASLIMIIIAITLLYFGYSISKNIQLDSLYVMLAIIFFGGGGLTGGVSRVRNYLKTPLVKLLYDKRKNEIEKYP